MSDATRILQAIEQGDPHAAEQLLPLVYEELRKLAAARLAHEKPGQTLQATALVHEAYLRLVDTDKAQHWNSRRHFISAAAEAMRQDPHPPSTGYLSQQPVEATPPSSVYRMREFVRRNRVSVVVTTMASLLLMLLVGGSWITAVSQLKAMTAQAEIEKEAEKRREAEKSGLEQEQRRREAEQRESDLKWLNNVALPSLEKLKAEEKWSDAFEICGQARHKFPEDGRVQQQWPHVSCTWAVASDPSEAKVFTKPFDDGGCRMEGDRSHADRSSTHAVRGMFLWKIVKDGFRTVRGPGGAAERRHPPDAHSGRQRRRDGACRIHFPKWAND